MIYLQRRARVQCYSRRAPASSVLFSASLAFTGLCQHASEVCYAGMRPLASLVAQKRPVPLPQMARVLEATVLRHV